MARTSARRGAKRKVWHSSAKTGGRDDWRSPPKVIDALRSAWPIGLDTRPLGTVTARDRYGLIGAFLTRYQGTSTGAAVASPVPTVTGGGEHLGLVTVMIAGEPYAIVDIGMRMLTPRELARAQGFPDSYVIERGADGRRVTRTDQVRLVGNSVCQQVARALIEANNA